MKFLKLISIISIIIFILLLAFSAGATLWFEDFYKYLSVIAITLVNIALCITLIVLLDKKISIKDSKIKFSQFNKKQKVVSGFIILVILIPVILFFNNLQKVKNEVLLFSNLNVNDYSKIIKKLQGWEYYYRPDTDNRQIWVYVKDRGYIKGRLVEEGFIPKNIKGWEIIDIEKFPTDEFERKVNARRALVGELRKHLMSLEDIEYVSISIGMPNIELSDKGHAPWTASIIITPASNSDITKNRNKINTIKKLAAFAIGKLSPENILISDNNGNILSD